MKYLLVLISLFFISCSTTITIPEKVYIPIKCEIELPKEPTNNAKDELDYEGILLNAKDIKTYTEVLEYDLKFCIKGELK